MTNSNNLGRSGMELCACHYRIENLTSRIWLSEVTLGLLLGGGGTQRLPWLIDAAVALPKLLLQCAAGGQMTASKIAAKPKLALPELCQTGGFNSRICERGTKGCTVVHKAKEQGEEIES